MVIDSGVTVLKVLSVLKMGGKNYTSGSQDG